MAYGISVSNVSGYIQIDQDYSNYVTSQTGSISCSTTGTTLTYVDRGVPPMVFVKYPSTTHFVGMVDCGRTSLKLQLFGASTTGLVEYMLAYPINLVSPPAAGFGLRVLTASGGVAFDSNWGYPRVSNIISGVGTSSGWSGPYTATYAPAKANPWICISALWGMTGRSTSPMLPGGGYLVSSFTTCVRSQGVGVIGYDVRTYETVSGSGPSFYTSSPTNIVLLENA
jgi:hypothetical protein